MSAVTAPIPTDPKELRPLLHAEVDRLPDEHLGQVHRLLLELEVRRVMDDLGASMDEAWASGQMTEASVQEAILEHRRKHPYR